MISNYQNLKKTLSKEEVSGLKNPKLNGIVNGSGHTSTKSPLVTKSQDTIAPTKNSTLSHLKSPSFSDKTSSKGVEKKSELKPVNGVLRSQQEDEKHKERTMKVKVKLEKDERVVSKSESENSETGKGQTLKSNTTSKSKPPKIRLPERYVKINFIELVP